MNVLLLYRCIRSDHCVSLFSLINPVFWWWLETRINYEIVLELRAVQFYLLGNQLGIFFRMCFLQEKERLICLEINYEFFLACDFSHK